ncbi:MAG: DnaA N-terminal domain-containing protein, partial [Rhodoplanes sp.]
METPAGAVTRNSDSGIVDAIEQAWEAIRAGLRRDCGARTFDGWLRPIALGGFDADVGTVRLELPSQFMADWVQTHFAERLALAWRQRLSDVRQIRIGVGAAAPRTAAVVEIPAPPERPEPEAK